VAWSFSVCERGQYHQNTLLAGGSTTLLLRGGYITDAHSIKA
jgi:hypothetical protein